MDIVFLLIVAVLIFARLRSVLGTRPEKESKVFVVSHEDWDKMQQQMLNECAKEEEQSPFATVFKKIPNFSSKDFCNRAAKVFEMVLSAFANHDEETLKMLMSKKLFEKFHEIIQTREKENIRAESELIRIEKADIQEAKISSKGVAQIVVQFVSEQINLLKNAKDEVIEGDENFVQKITDIWTFERNVNTASPQWFLVSTKKKS